MTTTLLEVKELRKYFPVFGGLFRRKIGEVKAVDGIDFGVDRGEIIGIVGESGSGKTTTGRMIARIYEPTSGSILFDGEEIGRLKGRAFRPFRMRIQMFFQDTSSSLNP